MTRAISRIVPSQEQLAAAHREAGLRMPLEVAMQSRPLSIALINTASALAERQERLALTDHKRRAAGDTD